MTYTTHKDVEVTKAWLAELEKTIDSDSYDWGFVRKEDGKLTTKAAKAMIAFGVKTLKARKFTATHAKENPNSGKVMEMVGFCYAGDGRYDKIDGSRHFEVVKDKLIIEVQNNMNFQGFIDTIKQNKWELYGIEVFQGGQIVEQYHEEPIKRHPIYSATKSITSLAVGMAVDDGKFDIDASIYEYLKSEVPAYISQKQMDTLKKITVKRLLTMSVQGYPFRPEGENWLEYSLTYPLEKVEEKGFDYSNIPAYLVGVAVAKALGVDLYDYLEERLFDPLGIDKPIYQNCPSGFFYGASGMQLTVQELTKIGQLCLQKGIYEGNRLVSEEYIKEATSIQQMNREGGYGYYFWKYDDGYRISGKWGQRSYVFPEKDMVVTYLSNMENGCELLTEAMRKYILV